MFLKGETMDLGGVPGRLATRCWQAGYGVAGRPGMNVPHSMDLYGGGWGGRTGQENIQDPDLNCTTNTDPYQWFRIIFIFII